MSFDKVSYDKEYVRQNYDRVEFTVPKGKRKVIKDFADAKGISVAQLVVDALEAQYHLELGK